MASRLQSRFLVVGALLVFGPLWALVLGVAYLTVDEPGVGAHAPVEVPLNGLATGTYVLHTRDGTYLATLAYARSAPQDLRWINDTLARYTNVTVATYGPTDNASYAAQCLQACPPREAATGMEGADLLLDQLRRNLTRLAEAYGRSSLLRSDATVTFTDGTFLAIAFAKVGRVDDAPNATLLEPVEQGLSGIGDLLNASCRAAGCGLTRAAISVEARWDSAWGRFDDLGRPDKTHVLGPLTWTAVPSTTLPRLPDAVPGVTRVPLLGALGLQLPIPRLGEQGFLFAPTAALGVALAGFGLSVLYNPTAKLLGVKDRPMPMPLLGALLAGGSLLLVHRGWVPFFSSAAWFVAFVFLAAFVLVALWYRSDPLGPIDVSLSWYGIAAVVVPLVWLVAHLDELLRLEPLGILHGVLGGSLARSGSTVLLQSGAILAWFVLVGASTLFFLDRMGRLMAHEEAKKRDLDPKTLAPWQLEGLKSDDASLDPLAAAYLYRIAVENVEGPAWKRAAAPVMQKMGHEIQVSRALPPPPPAQDAPLAELTIEPEEAPPLPALDAPPQAPPAQTLAQAEAPDQAQPQRRLTPMEAAAQGREAAREAYRRLARRLRD